MKLNYEFLCQHCGKIFNKELSNKEYEHYILRNKIFCCRSCANVRQHSQKTKENISMSLKKHFDNIPIECLKPTSKKYIKLFKTYKCGSKENDVLYPEISKHLGTKWFKNLIPFGFNFNTLYTEKVIEEYNKVKSLLYNEYINNKLSPRDIYEKYNCSEFGIKHSELVLHIIKAFKIPHRSFSAAATNAYLLGKGMQEVYNQYKTEHHLTWEGNTVFLRSSYESDYANILDLKHIKYEVEKIRIKYLSTQTNNYLCAIPDFYLPETNELVEIKSCYTLDVQNMLDKFKAYKAYGYVPKLILEHQEVDLYEIDKLDLWQTWCMHRTEL